MNKERQIKATMRYYLLPVRITYVQKSGNSAVRVVVRKEPLFIVGANIVRLTARESNMEIPQKMQK